MSIIIALLWNLLGKVLESRGLGILAESCFRKAIEAAPQRAGSRSRLGRILLVQKRYPEALSILEEAVKAQADNAECWNGLGVARRECGDMPGAKQAFDRALAIRPTLVHAQNNIGNWLLAAGDSAQALDWFDKALQLSPNFYEALNNRVAALLDLGKSEEAEAAAKRGLECFPMSAPLYLNLGNSYLQRGKGFSALGAYRRALELEPGFEEAHFNLSLLGVSDHLGNAISFLKKEVERRGQSIDLLNRLAIASMAKLSFDEAACLSREILEKNNEFVPAHVTLGNVLSAQGNTREALACYERALEIRPEHYIHSNLLFELNYFHDYSPVSLFQKHCEWAVLHEQPLIKNRKRHAPEGDRHRRLKIGYVSPDFHSHPVGFLTCGVISKHDRNAFEIHCYAHGARIDSITEMIRNGVDHWHDTMGLTDSEVADQVFNDGIDILIDLSGHTANHRLPTFAQKPAPIQATWTGYFHSTGMDSIDYFITDPYSSPRGSRQFFSETPVHLPHTRFCYTPPDYVPDVAPPPFLKNGIITFGCFNKLAKMTDEVVGAWAQILTRMPDSRIWLKSPALNEKSTRGNVHERFAAFGIDPARIFLKPASGHAEMLQEYGEIDIALDPFPFNGGMTTFEALLMGVPVITLAGSLLVARQSVSALSNLELDELIHETIPAYVEGAVTLASNRQRLLELRQAIRPKMESSPLCNATQLARDLEDLYRRMWHAWCDGSRLPSALEEQNCQ
jgi:predicted O-linked N-acetylglucosamine transferase (SPINDLY family)